MTILVTGGAGFIGSNFIHYMLKNHPGDTLVNVDLLTYAGNLENLEDVKDHPHYFFEKADICDRSGMEKIVKDRNVEAVINFAAESHVDRSILGSAEFIRTNVTGTQVLLDLAKQFGLKKFLQVSTDEVYGSLGATGLFTEQTPLHPNSPYSASKAGADVLAMSYQHTFSLPIVITRCSNNYGPYQFPEKLIPLMIANALNDKPLPVYGDGRNVRDWLHVWDHCTAIDRAFRDGKSGEIYNIGGNNEWKNIDIVRLILKLVKKSESLITYVQDRLGHDRRYAIDSSKIQNELGWKPSYTFERGIEETVKWYMNNKEWWGRIMSGTYTDYYRRMYEGRETINH